MTGVTGAGHGALGRCFNGKGGPGRARFTSLVSSVLGIMSSKFGGSTREKVLLSPLGSRKTIVRVHQGVLSNSPT